MGEPFRTAPGQRYPSAVWFATADADHDGAIDRAEFVADAMRFFKTIDLDHDGQLTPDEVAAYELNVAPETSIYAARPDDGDRRGDPEDSNFDVRGGTDEYGGPMGAGRYSWLNVPEPVAAADEDVDRVVTAREFADTAGATFDSLDKARTGRLTLAALGMTPMQVSLEGPCRQRRRRNGDDR